MEPIALDDSLINLVSLIVYFKRTCRKDIDFVLSSATRRRNRERHAMRPSESPERRAFQPPPNVSARHMHPAAMLQHPPLPHHQRQHQHPVVVDMEQVRRTAV